MLTLGLMLLAGVGLMLLTGVITGAALLQLFIMVVVVGLIFWLVWWFLGYVAPPEPFNKVLRVIIGLAALLFLINALLSLIGKSFISW